MAPWATGKASATPQRDNGELSMRFSRLLAAGGAALSVALPWAWAVLALVGQARADVIVTDLGTLPGYTTSVAYGINNSGQVVGASSNIGGQPAQAFLYSGGVMTGLGTLGGTSSYADGINDSGQVVGQAFTNGLSQYHAFGYSSGVMTDLGTLPGAMYSDSAATGINNSGQVVGYSYASSGIHAFLYSGGAMTDLGTFWGMVQKRPFSGNTWALSADPERSRVGAG